MIFLHSITVLILSFVFISCGSDKNNNNNNFNNNIETRVTELSNDNKATKSKTWEWGCSEYNKQDKKSKAGDCTYRHVINQKTTHKFASNVKYNNTRKATKKGGTKDDRTKHYIHVQARSKSNIVSKVTSVYALLDTTPPQNPKSNTRAPTSRSTGKTFNVTVSSLKKGDTVTIYVAGGSTSEFLGFRFLASLFSRRNTEGSICIPANAVGKETVSSGTSVTVTVTAREGTNSYHAQVIDEAGNRGPCSEVFDHTNTGGILEVTGIATDKNPRRFKSWEWGCTTDKTLPCEYRHTINNKATHTFDSETGYTANNRADTTGRSDTLWYLHVQAKNTKRESNVKSVSVRIDRTKPATPNSGSVTYRIIRDEGNNHDLAVTFKDLLLGDRAEIYNRANCQGRALGKENVGSNNQAVITINVRNSRQQYYGKVVDKADNSSGCGAVFTYPDDVLPVLPAVTGLTNDDVPRQIKRWTWGCTTEDTHPCDYRYEINDDAILDSDAIREFNKRTYSNGNSASTNEEGDWYLHVQARNRAGESSIKSVSAEVDRTPPKTPTSNSMSFVSSDNHRLTVTFSDSGILQGERISIYNVSDCRGRTLGSETMANNNRAVITFTATSSRQKYYAQVVDVAGNKGGCGFIFSYPSVPAVVPVVTGLTDDDVPRQTKRWTWGCNTQNCTYRHVINQRATHTFGSRDAYSTIRRATKGTSRSEDGKWYIHVQARTTEGGESRVRTVYATIDRTPPATPTKDSIVYVVRSASGDNPEQIEFQFSNLDPGDTVKVYTMVDGTSSFHLGTETVASDETSVSVTVERRPDGTNYCAKVIDQAKNESAGCGLILTYPEPKPQIVLTIPMLNDSNNYLHDQPTFTVEKASGNKIELYVDKGGACNGDACCTERENDVEKVANETCPTTGPCTIKVDAGELSYPEDVDYEEYTFYVKKEHDGPDRAKDTKCSKGQDDKDSVVYNLWPYQAMHVRFSKDNNGCHLSKLGEIRCWSKNQGADVPSYLNRCLPPGGTFGPPGDSNEWLASFDPMRFAHSVDLGCRDSEIEPDDCPANKKYKALAISLSKFGDTRGNDYPDADVRFKRGHTCAILDNKKVKCWGNNKRGQLFKGDTLTSDDNLYPASRPFINLGPNITAKAISAGAAHTCVVDNNDKVKCWGDNQQAQLGLNLNPTAGKDIIGDANEALTPVDLGAPTFTAKAISAGPYHTCVIIKDSNTNENTDKVRCWGDNKEQQIKKDNVTINYGSASNTVASAGFFANEVMAKKVFAGFARTCIIKKSNSDVICRTNHGDLKTMDTTSQATLLHTPSATDATKQTIKFKADDNRTVASLSLGSWHACILSNTSEAICFGRTNIETDAHRKYVAEDLNRNRLGQGLDVQFIDTDRWNNCATLSNGHVKCWGAQNTSNADHDRPNICENDAPSS